LYTDLIFRVNTPWIDTFTNNWGDSHAVLLCDTISFVNLYFLGTNVLGTLKPICALYRFRLSAFSLKLVSGDPNTLVTRKYRFSKNVLVCVARSDRLYVNIFMMRKQKQNHNNNYKNMDLYTLKAYWINICISHCKILQNNDKYG